jgi:hypothetical protein
MQKWFWFGSSEYWSMAQNHVWLNTTQWMYTQMHPRMHIYARTHARTHKTHTLILNLSTECKKMHTGVVLIWYFLNRNHSIKICYISGSRFIYYYLTAHYISMPITQWQGHTSVHRVYNEWINKNQKLWSTPLKHRWKNTSVPTSICSCIILKFTYHLAQHR